MYRIQAESLLLNMIDNYFLQLMPDTIKIIGVCTTLKYCRSEHHSTTYIRVQSLNRNVNYKLCGICKRLITLLIGIL